ncbi:uncharacterized protein LOC134216516 [Armigeres subalbatus]|uniref:uncharacterized protein LOC134216516 n=1 Tax=Armigeres subalbatus TaxID=124917 RepID=UPI002ED3B9E2
MTACRNQCRQRCGTLHLENGTHTDDPIITINQPVLISSLISKLGGKQIFRGVSICRGTGFGSGTGNWVTKLIVTLQRSCHASDVLEPTDGTNVRYKTTTVSPLEVMGQPSMVLSVDLLKTLPAQIDGPTLRALSMQACYPY